MITRELARSLARPGPCDENRDNFITAKLELIRHVHDVAAAIGFAEAALFNSLSPSRRDEKQGLRRIREDDRGPSLRV